MTTDDGSFFGVTEEQEFQDWLDWAEQVVSAVLLASQRVSLAIAAGGFVIAGSNMIEKAPMLGYLSMGAAGVFGVWIAVASARGVQAGR
jgi:hypothetical protein